MSIKPLGSEDISEVIHVQRNAYSCDLHEPEATFAKKMSLFPSGAIGCFDDAVMTGYIFCHPWVLGEIVPLGDLSIRIPDDPNCMCIHDLAIDNDHLGQGLAGHLISKVLSLTMSMGLHACALVSVQGSQGFWEHHGFVRKYDVEYLPGVQASYMVKEGL